MIEIPTKQITIQKENKTMRRNSNLPWVIVQMKRLKMKINPLNGKTFQICEIMATSVETASFTTDVSLIETMNNYDELASKAKAKADAIRDALKEEMLRLDTEELNAGVYIVRYTSVISNRFDSTTFKRLYADLYKDFTKPVSSRFSVSC